MSVRGEDMQRDVIERIAVGGLAEIYLARERGPAGVSRLSVVKRLRRELRDEPEIAEMFADEARVLAMLEHPHVVRLYSASLDETPELVLEYLDGSDLGEVIRVTRGEIETSDVLDIGLALAEALAFAHARTDPHGRPLGIVHRDLTPRNVIVTASGVVKLLDFGIAKARSNVYETATGVMRGTPRYMAPEQVAGGAQDERVDVYALGLLLYELTTGTHPFGATAGAALHEAVLEAGVPYLLHADPEADRELADLVYHATRIDPGHRPRTMRDVLYGLAAIRGRHPAPRVFERLAALVQRVRSARG